MFGPILVMYARQAEELIPDTPALMPPENVAPNYEHPPNENHMANSVISICLTLSTLFFCIRCYARFIRMQTWHIGDVFACLTFALYIPYIYFNYDMSFTTGFLVHQWNLTLKGLEDFLWITTVGTNIYIVILALVKIAILLDWSKLFWPRGTTKTYLYWACQVMIAMNALFAIITFIMTNVNCTPYSRNWDVTEAGTCRFNLAEMGLASAVMNFILDLITLVIPQWIVWGLQVSTMKKIGLSFVFLVGLIGCSAACIRLVYVVEFSESTDVSYNFSIVALCSLAEVTCGILVLCVPSAPKALASLELGKIYSSLKSWTVSNFSSSKLRSLNSKSEKPSHYSSSASDRSLQHTSPDATPPGTARSAITRVTCFSATSERISDEEVDDMRPDYHPWTQIDPETYFGKAF